ncbi:hypothetical protein ABZP36_023960 [Zizania latifolia]
MHMVSESIDEHVLTRAMESEISEKKAMQEQELTVLSNKMKCFACKGTSHTLDQCSIKERLVTGAHLFAHSTRLPFYMIQPSEEAVEKQKLYHHCLLITSDISNLDPTKVKFEVSKFWKLTSNWEIKREGRQNFLVSFNSENDLISCLKTSRIETSVDDKDVNFTIAKWKEGDEEKLDLVRDWFLVYGVPRIYRNWKELYQIVSVVGVLIEVDEESLEGEDKEPIRLKVALISIDDAPFSCHFVFGWYSRLVTFMIEDKVQRIDSGRKVLEDWNGEDHLDDSSKECKDKTNKIIEIPLQILNRGMNSESSSHDTNIVASTGNNMLDVEGCSDKEHEKELKTTETVILVEEPKFNEELVVHGEIKSKQNNISAPVATTTNTKKAEEDIPKAEREQSTSGNSTSLIGDTLSKGIQRSPIKNVYVRRHKMQKGPAEQQISSKKLDEEMSPECRNHATRNAASTGCNELHSKSCMENEHEKETKTAETALAGEGTMPTKEFGGDGKNIDNNINALAATVIHSKKTTESSPKAEGGQSTSGNSRSMIGDTPFRGIERPPIKIVYARRNKMQKGSMEKQVAIAKLNKEMNPESSSHATRIAASAGQKSDSKSCIEKEHQKELEIALVRQGQKSVKGPGGDGKIEDSNARAPSATAIKSTKQTTEDTVKIQGALSISGSSIGGTQTKGVGMSGTGPGGAQFDAKHVSKMNKQEFSTYIYESFTEMGLQENLLKDAYGLDKPSAVHQRGIVPLCKGLDIIQQSLSGTTVTLCCGVLQRLNYASTECQALVLVPTRDLAHETEKVIGALSRCLGVKVCAFFGGTSAREDQQILSSGVQVVVGTPGRVLDMLIRQALCPDHIRMFVLDEADEVLRGGFKDQIHDIIQFLPTKTQFGVFSATMSHEALEICHKFMNKPVEIIVPREELQDINIKQFYVNVEKEDCKLDKLCDLLDSKGIAQNIIFVNTRRKVKSLTEEIRGKGYTVSASHGGMDQRTRDIAVQKFQSGSSRIIIATDLCCTDVLHSPTVINYDLPTQPVSYLRHVMRIGHRGGKGVAISFITHADKRVFSTIQKFSSAKIEELPSNVADLF